MYAIYSTKKITNRENTVLCEYNNLIGFFIANNLERTSCNHPLCGELI